MTGERVISIPGLCKQVLKKWKSMLVFGMIIAVLLAGYKYIKQSGTKDADLSEKKEVQKEMLPYADRKEVLDAIQESIARKTEYIRDSVLLNIDNTREGYAAAYVYVTTDELEEERAGIEEIRGDYVAADLSESEGEGITDAVTRKLIMKTRAELEALRILDQYKIFIDQEMDLDDTAEKFETKEQYLREIITTDSQDEGAVCFRVGVQYYDQEGAEAILDCILEKIEGHQTNVSEQMGVHTLSIGNRSSELRVNRNNNSMMNTRVKEINDLSDTASKYKTLIEAEEKTNTKSAVSIIDKKILLKNVVVGLVGGCAVFCILYAILLLLKKRVLSARELVEQYKIHKIAYIQKGDRNKKKGIDGLINRIGSSYLSSGNEEDGYAIAAENISSLSEDGKVALISDRDREFVSYVADKLKAYCEGKTEYLVIKRDSIKDIQKLKECTAAVLVADENSSKYNELDSVVEQAQLQKIKILGAIVCA